MSASIQAVSSMVSRDNPIDSQVCSIRFGNIPLPERISPGCSQEFGGFYVINNGTKLVRQATPALHFRDGIDHDFNQFKGLKLALSRYIPQREVQGDFHLFGSILRQFISNETLSSWGIYHQRNKLDAAAALSAIVDCMDTFSVPTPAMLHAFETNRPYMNSGRLGAIFKLINPRDLDDCLLLARQKSQLENLVLQFSPSATSKRFYPLLEEQARCERDVVVNTPEWRGYISKQIDGFRTNIEGQKALFLQIYETLSGLHKGYDAPWTYFALMNDPRFQEISEIISDQLQYLNWCMGILGEWKEPVAATTTQIRQQEVGAAEQRYAFHANKVRFRSGAPLPSGVLLPSGPPDFDSMSQRPGYF